MLEGSFLLIHVSLPSPVGSWANAFVMSSLRFLQAQAAAEGFWQLKQPVTSLAYSFSDVRKLVVNVCCVARDMCVDGSPWVNPATFFSNHACKNELAARCRGGHDHIEVQRLGHVELFGRHICANMGQSLLLSLCRRGHL